MRQRRTELKRLQRELDRQQQRALKDAQRIRFIEVYCDGELVEVMPVGAKAIAVGDIRVNLNI